MLPVLALACLAVQAGQPETCTISRVSGGAGIFVMFATSDGTAKAGVDYTSVHKQVYLKAGVSSIAVSVPTSVNPAAAGTLTFNASITAGLSVVSATGSINQPSPPAPAPSYVPAPTLAGIAPIASEFDPQTTIFASYMPNPQPAGENVGAFRFNCAPAQLRYDDPLVFPGQPGKSHLHQFYGNLGANAYSTRESLRKSGQSTCGDPGSNPANRSAYWFPAMLDGKGNVVQADQVNPYYKRTPASFPGCMDGRTVDKCVGIPNGMSFIFGFNMLTGQQAQEKFHWYCNATGAGGDNIAAALPCPVGSQLIARADAPWCWDGKNLDTPDHRSHLAWPVDLHDGGPFACDANHRIGIPALTLGLFWTIAPGDDPTTWHLSSDEMFPNLPAGTTMHADYIEAWDPTVKAMWQDNCIDKYLNCAGGALGNGYSIIDADMPTYRLPDGTKVKSWTNPQHLVPVPPRPAQ